MLPYWLLIGYFAFGTLTNQPRFVVKRSNWPLIIGAIYIAVMIGFRNEVGTDWHAYYQMYKLAGITDLSHLLAFGDPGYQLLNWLAHQLRAGFWFVNTVCGLIFAWGLYRLARVQPDPWAAILVAVPYLVIVVAMGYARQGVAIGILMAGLAKLSEGGSIRRFVVYVAGAALFHRTAVVALPLGILGLRNQRVDQLLAALGGGLAVFDLLLSNRIDNFIDSYIQTELSSKGAGVRIAMNFLPATIFFLSRKNLRFTDVEAKLWRNFSCAAYFAILMYFVIPSSTAVDRVALYLQPLQIVILSRVGFLLKSDLATKAILILYSSAVLIIWLNYGETSFDWVPYHFKGPLLG